MQPTHAIDSTRSNMVLAVSLELAKGSWKVAMYDGQRDQPALQSVARAAACERLEQVVHAVEATKRKWGLDENTRIVVCYEAGQDGFWIARALSERGYAVKVVDPASLLVARHARRAKTDRLDAIRLVLSLLAWERGERDRMHVVRVPAAEAEAQRHLTRERGQLQKEIGQHRDRVRKLLRTVGCWDPAEGDVGTRLMQGQLRCHDGGALPGLLQERLVRECARLALAQQQLKALEVTLAASLPATVGQRITQLMRLKGVGRTGATRLVLELFWRRFANPRQVGACVGLVPQPYDSGEYRADQGISKQGNRRVRALLIEMAWLWLRYQPRSALAMWFAQRTQIGTPNKRGKRIAIVAVARRLAIALWRYLEHGVFPAGAQTRAA